MFDPIRTASRTANPGRGAAFAGALVALLTAAGAQAAPEKAGVSTAVKGSVSRTSTLSSGQPDEARELLTGSSVFMQDRVSAAEESRAQLMLLDESTFTLGPSSDVVIDKFIYDPETGTGELVAQATTGAFRFVSGAIGKTNAEDVTVKTPLGTMGVRGTIVTADIRRGPDGALVEALFVLSGPGIENNANARRGAILITANGRTVPVQRTGWGVRVRPGEPPSDPFPVPPRPCVGSTPSCPARRAEEPPQERIPPAAWWPRPVRSRCPGRPPPPRGPTRTTPRPATRPTIASGCWPPARSWRTSRPRRPPPTPD